VVAGYRRDRRVLPQKLFQVGGTQCGVWIAAVNGGKPLRELPLENTLNRASAILEDVVVNHHVSGSRDRHSYIHDDASQ
jgi:predicted metalloprotease